MPRLPFLHPLRRNFSGRAHRPPRWQALRRGVLSGLLLCAALALLSVPLAAQDFGAGIGADSSSTDTTSRQAASAATVSGETPNIIVSVRVEGISQVERGQVLTDIGSRVDAPLDPNVVTQDLKTIFNLGFFRDVSAVAEEVAGEGYRLIFRVVERPRIVNLRLQGNTVYSDTDLFERFGLRIGGMFSSAALDDAATRVKAAYREKGFLQVGVTPRVEQLDADRYSLTFEIVENPRLYITTIRTHGNAVFSQLEIQRMMASAEVDCFDWMNDSGKFDENKVNTDLQVISAQYLQLGYIRVFIDKPRVLLRRGNEFSEIRVDLDITDGAQYFTGELDITGDILGEKDDLMNGLRLETGEPYNPFAQNQDIARLREIYQEQGYAFVQVLPDARINDETHIVDVTYRIIKGEKAYVGRIEFQGNRETRDYVLRREVLVREDELYNGRKLRQSQQNLLALGYFQPSLSLDEQPRDVDNVLDVVTKVEETQTGNLQAQLGYSDQQGITGSITLSKGNLGGRGQTLRVTAEAAQRNVTRTISSDFIEPHLLDSAFSSDSSVSYSTIQDTTELDRGTIEELQGSQGFGHPIFSRLTASVTYSATNRSFEAAEADPVQLRSVTNALRWNSVNHPLFPSAGSNIVLAATQVGGQMLGGTTEYRRYRFTAQRFDGLNDSNSVVFMSRLRLGWLEQVGDNVIPSEDRFRIGGITSLRGYSINAVGGPYGTRDRNLNQQTRPLLDDQGKPVFDSNGNPLQSSVDERALGLTEDELTELRSGGVQERLLNLEMLFPLAGNNIRGVLFYDAGNVNAERRQYALLGEEEPEFFELLHAYCTGVRMITPLGVFRFEYGVKVRRERGESPDRFDFTISTLF